MGAARHITLQVGGCARRRLEEEETGLVVVEDAARELNSGGGSGSADTLRVAEFTNNGIQFFKSLTFPDFIVPKGTAALDASPSLATKFGTAGIYFYYGRDGKAPDVLDAPAVSLACDATTYGSFAINTFFPFAYDSSWICGFDGVAVYGRVKV